MGKFLKFSAFVLGVSSALAQVLLQREFMQLFGGNELIIGVNLGVWTLFTGLGALFARNLRLEASRTKIAMAHLFLGSWPLLGITILRFLPMVGLFTALESGPGIHVITAIVVFAPFSFLSGWYLIRIFSLSRPTIAEKDKLFARIYALDSLGMAFGGALFSFFLVWWLDCYSLVFILFFIHVTIAIYIIVPRRIGLTLCLTIPLMIIITWTKSFDLEQLTLEKRFGNNKILSVVPLPFGQATLLEHAGQRDIYLNNVPIGSTAGRLIADPMIHWPLLMAESPRHLLLLGGGLWGGLAPLALHPGLDAIDYVETHSHYHDLVKQLFPELQDNRIRFWIEDVRRFLGKGRIYDVIIMQQPDPDSLYANRYYSLEFFQQVSKNLTGNGIFGFALAGAPNYQNEARRLLISVIYQTLHQVFPHIIIIPGDKVHFLASHEPLVLEKLTLGANALPLISPAHLNFFKDRLRADRLQVMDRVKSNVNVPLNYDINPVVYNLYNRYHAIKFKSLDAISFLIIVLLIAFSLMALFATRPLLPAIVLFTSGIAGMSVQFILLLLLQIVSGYIYEHLGSMMAAFLLGIYLGAQLKIKYGKPLVLSEAIILASSLLLTLLIFLSPTKMLGQLHTGLLLTIFIILNIFAGFGLGMQIGNIKVRRNEKGASALLVIDFLGAALAAFGLAHYLIAQSGLLVTMLFLIIMKFATFIAAIFYGKKEVKLNWTNLPNGVLALVFMSFAILILAMIVADSDGNGLMQYITLHPVTLSLWLLLLVTGILAASGWRLLGRASCRLYQSIVRLGDRVGFKSLRLFYFCGFIIVALLPILRCYFKVPYIFCHICPRRCLFGVLRPYLVPAALLMNLTSGFWCERVCPIGSLQDCQHMVCPSRRRPSHLSWYFSLPLILILVSSYFLIFPGSFVYESDIYNAVFRNTYTIAWTTISVALLLTIGAFIWPRLFCRKACPIGITTRWLIRINAWRFSPSRERISDVQNG